MTDDPNLPHGVPTIRVELNGETHEAAGAVVIGRAPDVPGATAVTLMDPRASRTHVEIGVVGGVLSARDAGSSNGTELRVGGQTTVLRAQQWIAVPAGAVLIVGDTEVTAALVAPAVRPAADVDHGATVAGAGFAAPPPPGTPPPAAADPSPFAAAPAAAEPPPFAAAPAAEPPPFAAAEPPPFGAAPGVGVPPGFDQGAPAGFIPPQEESGKGNGRKILIIALVVLGLAALGYLAYRLLSGSDSDFVGGASTPEGAVEELAAAISAEDLLAASSFFAPDELNGVGDLGERLIELFGGDLDDLTNGDDDADSPVDLTVEVHDVRADRQGDRAAIVSFGLSGAVETDGDAGEIGELLGENETAFTQRELEDAIGGDVEVIVVELGGNWYISPMLTLGHIAFEQAGLPSGDFDRVGEPVDSDASSPEEAVELFVHAIVDRDAGALAAALGGGDGRFVAVFEDAIDELFGQISEDVTFDIDVRTEDLGDGRVALRQVRLGGSVRNTFDDNRSGELVIDGDCASTLDSERQCLSDRLPLADEVERAIVVRTVSENGAHRVLATTSLVGTLTDLANGLDRQTVLFMTGMEWAETAEPATLGTDIDVTFDGELFKVFEFPVQPGERYRIAIGAADFAVLRNDTFGRYTSRGQLVIPNPSETSIGVVVYSDFSEGYRRDTFDFPTGEGRTTLRLSQVEVQRVAFPGALSGTLAPGEEIVYELDVRETTEATVTVDGIVFGRFVSNDPFRIDGSLYEFSPGITEYSLLNESDTDQPYTVTFEVSESAAEPEPEDEPETGATLPKGGGGTDPEGGDDISGGLGTTTVSLDDGPAILTLDIPAGARTIVATPLEGQDIILIANECFADAVFTGPEECTFEFADTTTVGIVVSSFDPTASFGQVTVTIT